MGYEELDRQYGMQGIMRELDVGENVASELYILAGYDAKLAIRCGKDSDNLTMCKARIVNERLRMLERKVDEARWRSMR